MRALVEVKHSIVLPLRLAVQSGRKFCMGGAVASEYRLQPEVNKGLQARETLFSFEKRGHGNGAEAPESLPPEGGTRAPRDRRI